MTARFTPRTCRGWLSLIGLVALTVVGASFALPSARGGVTLTLVGNLPVNPAGTEVGFVVRGAPNTLTFFAADSDPGPTVKPWGIVNLGFSPELVSFQGTSSPEGVFRIDCIVDCDHPFLGRTVYLQAWQVSEGQVCLSNTATVLWDDVTGKCGGEDLCPGRGKKPQVLTMVYTGDDCSATNTSQEPGKVSCSGDPGFAAMVHIISRDPSGKQIWFEGDVALGGAFDIDATNAGATRLKGDTIVDIYDASGTTLLQSVQFHTSCSQPLVSGDQFGGVELLGFIAE